jgi:tetratricopeptide (TPR) repeat protein
MVQPRRLLSGALLLFSALAPASQTDPKRAQKAYELGLAAAAQNRPAEALESLTTAILYAPDFANAYRERGKVFVQRNEPARAARSSPPAPRPMGTGHHPADPGP